MSQQQPTDDRLAQVMENSTAVVMLRLTGLPGNRAIPGTETLVEGKTLHSNAFSAPTMRLMPAEWSSKFSQLHTKAEKLIKNVSPPKSETFEMPLPVGCHLIAGRHKQEIAVAIHGIMNNELVPLREEFCDAFPAIVAARRAELASEAIWSQISGKIPTSQQLRNTINLRFIILPFTFLNEAGRILAEDVAQSIIAGISETLEEEANKLQEKISRGAIFKDGSFSKIRQHFQMLKDFSFLTDEETVTKLMEVENAMSSAELAGSLNAELKHGSGSAGNIVAAITGAIQQLTGEAKKDAGGRFKRRINI